MPQSSLDLDAGARRTSQEDLRSFAEGAGKLIFVSPEDLDAVCRYQWKVTTPKPGFSYARATVEGKLVFMHRWLMRDELRPGLVVDHIDGDGLNNRRENLRVCTYSDNSANTRTRRRFKGVSRYSGSWVARICKHGRSYYLGSFKTARRAAAAYNRVARRLFGEFANLNKLDRR